MILRQNMKAVQIIVVLVLAALALYLMVLTFMIVPACGCIQPTITPTIVMP